MAWSEQNLKDAAWIQDMLLSLASEAMNVGKFDPYAEPMIDDYTPEPTQWNGQDNRPMPSANTAHEANRDRATRELMHTMEDFADEFGGWDRVAEVLAWAIRDAKKRG